MKTKFNHAFALSVAEGIRDSLARFCERIEIVGSLRRKKSEVGDIELLFIPRIETRQVDMFATEPADLAHEHLNLWMATRVLEKRLSVTGVAAWGAKNKLAVHCASGVPVDFFSVPAENWHMSMVIRTGGKETNLQLTNGAIARNMNLQAYGAGFLKLGKVIPCHSEREVFELAGVPYAEPEDRK